MASTNPDSMTNAQGEFAPSVPRDEPLTTKGHQVGKKVSPADHAPEFSAKTLPAGSAPANRTFRPNSKSETPGQADNADVLRSHGKESTYTSAEATLGGTDSGAVNTGLGYPGQGQTSSELKHASKHGGAGLEDMGGSGMTDGGNAAAKALQAEERGEGPTPEHYRQTAGAADMLPESAESVAAQRD